MYDVQACVLGVSEDGVMLIFFSCSNDPHNLRLLKPTWLDILLEKGRNRGILLSRLTLVKRNIIYGKLSVSLYEYTKRG